VERGRERALVVDEEPGHAVLDDVGKCAAPGGDHRRAARQRLDGRGRARLLPAHRAHQRPRAADEARLRLAVDAPDPAHPLAVDVLPHVLEPVPDVRAVAEPASGPGKLALQLAGVAQPRNGARDVEPDADAAADPGGDVDALHRRDAAEREHAVALLGLERKLVERHGQRDDPEHLAAQP